MKAQIRIVNPFNNPQWDDLKRLHNPEFYLNSPKGESANS